MSFGIAAKPLFVKLSGILNSFQSDDEDAEQFWYLLGRELAKHDDEKYCYSKQVLVGIGQAEERAPLVLLNDLVEKKAELEEVLLCLERIKCKVAVDLLHNDTTSAKLVTPVEEQGGYEAPRGHGDQAQCEADGRPAVTNGHEESTSTSNLIGQEVFRPLPDPVIETHPTPVSIERGKSADFCCISRGEGISYTWYKNDRPIKGKRGRKLEIMSVTIEDEALYHCVVGNGTLTVCSRKAKLSVDTNIHIEQQPSPKQVLFISHGKQTVKLKCQAELKDKSLVYLWQKLDHKGDPVDENEFLQREDPEIVIPVVYGKLFGRLLLYFRCKIIDSRDKTNYIYSEVAEVEVSTVWITQDLKDVHAKLHTPTSLRCEGKGFTGCYWLRSSTKDRQPHFFRLTKMPVLHFSHLSQEDEGYYVCNLYNGKQHVTSRTSHLRPFLHEEDKRVPVLKILQQPFSHVIPEGTPLRLLFDVSCSTEDEVQYQWYLNGMKIGGEDGKDLKRESVEQDQCGRYWCEAMVGGARISSNQAYVRLVFHDDLQNGVAGKLFRYDSGNRFTHDKVALLIGNKSYESLKDLRSPECDIQELRQVLVDLNFKVFALVDLTFSEMQSALTMFYESLVPNTYALFYFSGHGYNDGTQNSFITPVDCPAVPEISMCFHLSDIISRMQEQKCRPLCVVDACKIVDVRVSVRQVKGITDPSDYISIWSTGDGSPADDTVEGNDTLSSPFNQAFRKAIETECTINYLSVELGEHMKSQSIERRGQYRDNDKSQYIDRRGQYHDNEIRLQDEILVSKDAPQNTLEQIEQDYQDCVRVPDDCWLSSKGDMKELYQFAKLLLEFTHVLTNVWQLKVTLYQIGNTISSASIEFDKESLETQGVTVVDVEECAEPNTEQAKNRISGSWCLELRGLQKLRRLESALKIIMTVTLQVEDETKKATLDYQTAEPPFIAKKFKELN